MVVAISWWEQHNAEVVLLGVGGLIAVVSGFVGNLLERRSGRSAWLRDRRLEAFVRFEEAHQEAWSSFRDIGDASSADHPTDEQMERANNAMSALAVRRAEMWALGPVAVGDAAVACYRSMQDLAPKAVTASITDADKQEVARLEREFVATAWAHIGHPR
jgi:hypothetical protein